MNEGIWIGYLRIVNIFNLFFTPFACTVTVMTKQYGWLTFLVLVWVYNLYYLYNQTKIIKTVYAVKP